MHEAGNFYALARKTELTVNLVQLSKEERNEGPLAPISRAMDEIKDFEAEVFLPYMEKENIERMLQHVIIIFTIVI